MLQEKVLEAIKKYELIKSGDNIIVGVSGGPDSICLLDVLNKIRTNLSYPLIFSPQKVPTFNIYVAHINHMLRENAIADEEYVKNFCENNNIECFVKRIDIYQNAKKRKVGLEEAGRIARYEFFEEICNKYNNSKIAIGHNSNDNAETVLMNIMRGCGISGIKGIEVERINIIRPLLKCAREEIEKYCELNNLIVRHDESNDDNIYTRNKVRNELIPYIQSKFNPNIISALNRLSEIVCEEERYLKDIISKEYINVLQEEKSEEIIINLKNFNKLDIVLKNRLILYIVARLLGNSKDIEKVHIEDIIKMCDKNIGNKYLSPNKHIKVLIRKSKIFFIKQQ